MCFSDVWNETNSSNRCNSPFDQVRSFQTVNEFPDPELHSCSYCGKSVHPSYLKRHIRLHLEPKPFKCSVCKKTFSHRGNLNQHYRIHTGEKPYTCHVCQKGFAQKSNLQSHIAKHMKTLSKN